jgi:CO/xanthine dehydrogenase FAD-binding subunit
LITGVKITLHKSRLSRFRKFAWRRASGKTLVNVAAALRIENGRIAAPRLAAGGLSKHPSRLPLAENSLEGQIWSDSLIEQTARAAAAEVVVDVISSPAEKYRRRLVAAGLRQLLAEMSRP